MLKLRNDSLNLPASSLLASALLAAAPAARAQNAAQDVAAPGSAGSVSLEAGWSSPPLSSRLRAYWWWLNGNVTRASITRDLEKMKAKGFGGALICDAGGDSQDGNAPVPHGPTFFSPAWRELYKHALREASRLGLEMSLNIQSGWNLGGPTVRASDAAKKLVWSEATAPGGARFAARLPQPRHQDAYYRDLFVVAYRVPGAAPASASAELVASSQQAGHEAGQAADGNAESFWVSGSDQPGQGPSPARPQWLQLSLPAPFTANRLTFTGRAGYGPRHAALQASDDGKVFRLVQILRGAASGETSVTFAPTRARYFRLLIFSAFDPRFPDTPRNVQIAELRLSGQDAAGRDAVWPSPGAGAAAARRPIQNLEQKAMRATLSASAPDTSPLLSDVPATPGEEDTRAAQVLDLTSKLSPDGTLQWDVPAGDWQILRFGCTVGDHSRVSTSSEGWGGYALDVLDEGAFKRYWDAVVAPLIDDAGPLAGRTLKYLHTDSWEVEAINWTPTLREEFRRIVEGRAQSNPFLNDFRKTLGDLAVDHHFKPFAAWAHARGLQIHPESGGPHAVPIDAQRTLGRDDVPMSEFWARSWRHRITDADRFFVKQPASAAHVYGKNLVAAEGFTTIGPHWQETIWDNLKPAFDRALCEGLNLLVWHAFVNSPAEMGLPGQQYFAGTHFNPNTTWWPKSGPFLSYIDRSQFLMQRGLFVADAAYYYGDHVPNFTQLRASDPAQLGAGYDYDVLTEEAILTRLSVRDGRLVLPDGMSYRVLVLPSRPAISLPVLRRLQVLIEAGATIIGPRPSQGTSLDGFPASDAEVERIASELWSRDLFPRKVGKGRVFGALPARIVLAADGVRPDFEAQANGQAGGSPALSYIHRRDGGTEIYFVANPEPRAAQARCTFRVADRAPELWNAVTGEHRFATAYTQANGRTTLPLEFTPCGSWFVIFRAPAQAHPATGQPNTLQLTPRATLDGPWTVSFDPRWGGPASAQFEQLASWNSRPEPGIRFYSGTATYRKSFDLPAGLLAGRRLALDLGSVHEVAGVRLNGQPLGIVWAPPFRVDISRAVKATGNVLEIEVVNFWPNRIIGDQSLPEAQRLTRTNIRKLTRDTPLMESGLLGPVQVLEARQDEQQDEQRAAPR